MIYSSKEYSVFGNLCKKAEGDNESQLPRIPVNQCDWPLFRQGEAVS